MPDDGFDNWIDAQLRNVPLPRDLHARLSAGRPPQIPTDDQLDAVLRNVPVPEHLERHLRRIAWHKPAIAAWKSGLLAASVLFALAAVTYLALWEDAAAPPKGNLAAGPAPKKSTAPPQLAARPAVQPRASQAPSQRQQPIVVPLAESHQATQQQNNPLPAIKQVAGVGSSLKQAIEARLRTQAALGSGGKIEQLPELDVFEPPAPRGIEPPRIVGYDLLFQLRYGEHPFVSPAAHRDLQVSRVPFTFHTASYDLAADEIERGRLPSAEEIRVEDFLAAQRYALPTPPSAGLALHAAASPSPLGKPGLHLLALAVQGAKLHAPSRAPLRLIAVVDTSSAMQFDARWKIVTRALADLASHLAPGDRLTVIGFAEQPRVLAEDVTRDDLEKLIDSGALQKTSGSADMLAGIQAACDAVDALGHGEPRRVAFVTARAELKTSDLDRAAEALSKLSAAKIPWYFVRVAPTDDDSPIDELARKAHGMIRAARSADELHAALVESLTGRSPAVALGVSMKITFNPKVVTSYRMLGHEAVTLTGQPGDPLEVDLHAEQTAAAMYELWLKPSADGEATPDIAIAELVWHDPATGQPRRRVEPIRRSQVARSFSAAAPWLQQAILAAKTAEYLRASYYVPDARRLERLLDLAAEVDAPAAEQPEFRALVNLVKWADALR
jgi:Ca-activated chloride channel family protein